MSEPADEKAQEHKASPHCQVTLFIKHTLMYRLAYGVAMKIQFSLQTSCGISVYMYIPLHVEPSLFFPSPHTPYTSEAEP